MIPAIFIWLAAVNAVGGLVFVRDKRSAGRNGRRVPERALLGLAALGAAPGMVWLSGRIRHKTRKQPFRALLLAILAAQVVAALTLALVATAVL